MFGAHHPHPKVRHRSLTATSTMRCSTTSNFANENAPSGNEPQVDERTPLLKAVVSSVRPVRSEHCRSVSDEEACNEGLLNKDGCQREPRNVAGVILILLIGE